MNPHFVVLAMLLLYPLASSAEPTSSEDHATELGKKIIAVRNVLQNPHQQDALKTVTDLGHDSRYYVLTRGWLNEELKSVNSLLAVQKDKAILQRLTNKRDFLLQAIRAIDLE